MSIAVLTQVYDEMRRLAIAGSVVAGGDFRLKKLIPPLEQAGAKAPVFAKVAQSVKTLVESNEQTSAQALLELCTLVNAVLYTQGETGLAGTVKPIETTDLGPQTTQASARVLKPLLEALSTTGSGRLEIIRDSFERGAFRDLRLVKPALNAIDDVYPEISQFIGNKVLPLYGKAILPELKAKFDIKGRAGHLRRLSLMHSLDPVGSREIVKQALDEGSKEIKIVAIECLGETAEDLAYLLEQSKAKAKDVRGAALKALTRVDATEAVDVLKKALAGADVELAVRPLRHNRNPKLLTFVIEEAEKQIDAAFAAKDKKDVSKHTERLMTLLQCLDQREDKATEAFLLRLFGRREELVKLKGEPSGLDINDRVAELMSSASRKSQQALVNAHATLSAESLGTAFVAAIRSMKPGDVYDMFSLYLTVKIDGKKTHDAASNRSAQIVDAITCPWRLRHYDVEQDGDDDDGDTKPREIQWDPRWLDLAVTLKDLTLVSHLARPGHAACNEFLSQAFAENLKKSKDIYDAHGVLETMVKIQHPAATDSLLATLKKHGTSKQTWGVYWVGRLIPELPVSAIEPLDELLPTLNENVIDGLMEYVTALKNKKTN